LTISFEPDGPAEFWYNTVKKARGNFNNKSDFMVWVNLWFEHKDRDFASMAWDLVDLEEGTWDDSTAVGSKG
jgi:hypothetical protein